MKPLRDQQFDEVTIKQIETAADSNNDLVYSGLVALIDKRLEDPEAISTYKTEEALVSLMKQGRSEAYSTVLDLAQKDSSENVRYLSLDVLMKINPIEAKPALDSISNSDKSALVRNHARELSNNR